MSGKKTWVKYQLKIPRNLIGLMIGSEGAILFGDIQTPACEDYMEEMKKQGKKINLTSKMFQIDFPSEKPGDENVYARWTCPIAIQKSKDMDRKIFNKFVMKHIIKVQSRILEMDEKKNKIKKYENTFRIRASTERRRVGMFIGNKGENVNTLKQSIKDAFSLKYLPRIFIREEGDDIEYMYDFDDDTDDSAWFTIIFNYLEEESISDAEVESELYSFLEDFDKEDEEEEKEEEEEVILDDELIGEW